MEAEAQIDTAERVVANIGKPQKVRVNFRAESESGESPIEDKAEIGSKNSTEKQKEAEVKKVGDSGTEKDGIESKEKTDAPAKENIEGIDEVSEKVEIPNELSNEQLMAFFKEKGITGENADEILGRLKDKPSKEEKQKAEKTVEDKRLNLFLEGGGTADTYVSIKNIANSDDAELSLQLAKDELKAEGFSDSRIEQIIEESYFQKELDEDGFIDDEEEAYFKKLKEYGSKKLLSKAIGVKAKAVKMLADLDTALESKQANQALEEQISSKIDEHLKGFDRVLKFEIGKKEDQVLPVDYKVFESDIVETTEDLKDPQKREKIFLNEDGSLNIPFITRLLIHDKIIGSAVNKAYKVAETRAAEEVESIYPHTSPFDFANSRARTNGDTRKGGVISMGKPIKKRAVIK